MQLICSTHVQTTLNLKGVSLIVKNKNLEHFPKYNSFIIHSFIHSSIGMCRKLRFPAVLSSFFHCSLLCTVSLHQIPTTSLPSLTTSSYHLFLGLPHRLFVYKVILNNFLGNSVLFHSLYMSKPTQSIYFYTLSYRKF